MLGSKECATRPTSAWFLVPSVTILFLQYNMGFLVTETFSVFLDILKSDHGLEHYLVYLSCLLFFIYLLYEIEPSFVFQIGLKLVVLILLNTRNVGLGHHAYL